MIDAENYYTVRVRDGTWNRPDENQQAILSLQAKVEKMAKSKDNRNKAKNSNKKDGEMKQTPKKPNKGKGANYPAWKTTPPKAADKLKAKYVKGDATAWYWCKKKKRYCGKNQRLRQESKSGQVQPEQMGQIASPIGGNLHRIRFRIPRMRACRVHSRVGCCGAMTMVGSTNSVDRWLVETPPAQCISDCLVGPVMTLCHTTSPSLKGGNGWHG